jgi:hypothetical protein
MWDTWAGLRRGVERAVPRRPLERASSCRAGDCNAMAMGPAASSVLLPVQLRAGPLRGGATEGARRSQSVARDDAGARGQSSERRPSRCLEWIALPLVVGWMDGWVVGWMDERLGGWMGGWVDG